MYRQTAKKLKDGIKRRLGEFLGLPVIVQQVTGLVDRQREMLSAIPAQELYGDSYWYEENLWEPPVQLALRDLCHPGAVVFDVGANFGGLTKVMSRQVGPRGVVCAFEASPRIVDKCQRNMVFNGCSNVQVYHTAVYHTSNQKIPLYSGTHLNDSIYNNFRNDQPFCQVATIALDDFISHTKLIPSLIKMDIEGAEFDAIRGMVNSLDQYSPHLILENGPGDTRCLDFLLGMGYMAIDLNSYKQVLSSSDYPEGVAIRNTMFIHSGKLTYCPYSLPFRREILFQLGESDFISSDSAHFSTCEALRLDKGRYIIDVNFVAQGTDNELMCGVKTEDKVIMRCHAYSKLIADSYRDWVIDLAAPASIWLYFDFLNGTSDATFKVSGASLSKVIGLDTLTLNLM